MALSASLAVDALVAAACVVLVLCAVGLVAFDDAADRLHYAGPATTVAPLLVALAVVIEEGFTSQAALKALSVAAALALTSPFVSFATLRAIRTREARVPAVPEAPLQQ